MDDLFLKLIETNNINIEKIITESSLSIDDSNILIHKFIINYQNFKLDDNTMYILLYLIIIKFKYIKFNQISKINEILKWHIINKKTKNNTYKLLDLHNNFDLINNKISETLDIFKNINGDLHKLIIKCKTNDDLCNIIIYHIRPIIESYKNDFIMISNNTISHELENRLLSLVNIFGLLFIKKSGCEIITNYEFYKLNLDEQIKYYKKCIEEIEKLVISIESYPSIKHYIELYIEKLGLVYENLKNI